MATRLINAAGGNYSAGGTWVGGVAPTAADDVDYSALTGTLTIDGTSGAPNLCRSFTATAVVGGTIAQASAKFLQIGDATTGNFVLVTGVTYAPAAGSTLKFVSTTTGNQITTSGKLLGLIVFDGIGGAWQLQDALSMNASATLSITLTNGALDTNGKTITGASGVNFSSNNSNTRSLTLGATNWTLSSGATPWDITTSTGMTLSAGSSTIVMTNTTAGQVFQGGGLTYGTLQNTVITTGQIRLVGTNTFGTLDFELAGFPNLSQTIGLDNNQTVSTQLTLKGQNANNRLYIGLTNNAPTQKTITLNGAMTAQYLDLQNITGAGSFGWNLSTITGGSGDCGGNVGITFSTPANQYWVSGTGNWSDTTKWMTTSGGAIAGRVPLPQDTARFDANSFTAGSQVVTFDAVAGRRIGGMNWTGATNTPTLTISAATPNFYSSLTFISAMVTSGTQNLSWDNRTGASITSNGAVLTYNISIYSSITTGLQGLLTINDNLTFSGSAKITNTNAVNGIALAAGITISGGTGISANKVTTAAGGSSGSSATFFF